MVLRVSARERTAAQWRGLAESTTHSNRSPEERTYESGGGDGSDEERNRRTPQIKKSQSSPKLLHRKVFNEILVFSKTRLLDLQSAGSIFNELEKKYIIHPEE